MKLKRENIENQWIKNLVFQGNNKSIKLCQDWMKQKEKSQIMNTSNEIGVSLQISQPLKKAIQWATLNSLIWELRSGGDDSSETLNDKNSTKMKSTAWMVL